VAGRSDKKSEGALSFASNWPTPAMVQMMNMLCVRLNKIMSLLAYTCVQSAAEEHFKKIHRCMFLCAQQQTHVDLLTYML
jgi:hypothetical protein